MSVPTLSIQQQGVGVVSADQVNSLIQTALNAPMLRSFVGISGMVVFLQSITTPGDGNSGLFYWNSSGTTPDDNLNFIVPTAAPASGGEWVRLTTSSGSLVLVGDVTGPFNANVIAIDAVTTEKIADGAVTTDEIADGAVTTAKLATNAISTTNITNNSVTNAKLAQAPALTLKGNNTNGTANELDLTVAQVQAMLGLGSGLSVQAYVHFIGQTTNGACTIVASSGITSVTRTGAGLYSVVIGAVTLTAQYAIASAAISLQNGFAVLFIPPNSVMNGSNTYTVGYKDNGGSVADPSRSLITFY